MKVLTVFANIKVPNSKWRKLVSFEMNYNPETTVKDLKFHLLAHTRDNFLPSEGKELYSCIESIGEIVDTMNTDKIYNDETKLIEVIKSNYASSDLSRFFTEKFELPKEKLYIDNQPVFKTPAHDNTSSIKNKNN